MKGIRFFTIICVSLLGASALAAPASDASKARASRGPASVTQDPRVAAGFPDPLVAKGQLKVLPERGSARKSGNWSLLNLEGASSLRTQGIYQPRSAASQTAQPAVGQANQVFSTGK